MRFATGFCAALMLAACKPAPPTLDPNAEVICRQFFEDVKNGVDLAAEPQVAHELKNPTSEAQIAAYRAMIPEEPARSITLQSWDATTNSTGTTTRLIEAYGYSGHSLVVRCALFKSPGGRAPVIVGFMPIDEADS